MNSLILFHDDDDDDDDDEGGGVSYDLCLYKWLPLIHQHVKASGEFEPKGTRRSSVVQRQFMV